MTVSIIVTSYNVEKYIKKCLQSLIDQSLKEIEIIVVDDGSTDGTRDIINHFAKKDKRIKTICFDQNSIGGVGTAANAGIKAASGKYIGFADGDDWYETEMFKLLYCSAKQSKADLAVCNYMEYDEEKKTFERPYDFSLWKNDCLKKISCNEVESKKLLLKLISVPWRKLYKRSFLEENDILFPIGDFFYEDNPFHWQCTTLAERIVFVDKVLCYHRKKRDGQTMVADDNRLLAMYRHYQIIYRWLIEKGLFETYKIELIGWLVNNTIWISRSISGMFKDELFSIFQKIALTDGKISALKNAKTISVGVRGKLLYLAAIFNVQKLFFRIAGKPSGESLFQKMRRGYREQGPTGLWLNTKRPFVVKIKNYKYQKRIAPKDDLLRELSDIKTEIRLLRARQLFLQSETKKRACSIERGKKPSH